RPRSDDREIPARAPAGQNLTVYRGTVPAAEILDHPCSAVEAHAGVRARHLGIRERDAPDVTATYGELGVDERKDVAPRFSTENTRTSLARAPSGLRAAAERLRSHPGLF